jgi:hypothetical protein
LHSLSRFPCAKSCLPIGAASKFPAANATGVSPSANLTATFSEDMKGSSINSTTFSLFERGSTTKAGVTVSYSTSTDRATHQTARTYRYAPGYGLERELGDGTDTGGDAAAADIDKDGWQDLLMQTDSELRLYQNDRGTRFTDVTGSVGLGGEPLTATRPLPMLTATHGQTSSRQPPPSSPFCTIQTGVSPWRSPLR